MIGQYIRIMGPNAL